MPQKIQLLEIPPKIDVECECRKGATPSRVEERIIHKSNQIFCHEILASELLLRRICFYAFITIVRFELVQFTLHEYRYDGKCM